MKNLCFGKAIISSFIFSVAAALIIGITPVSAATTTYLVDFGRSTSTTAIAGWNNVTDPRSGTVLNLINTAGASTGASLQITNSFYYNPTQAVSFSTNINGTTASTLYPSSATMDSFFLGSLSGYNDTAATIALGGLNAANTYDFRFYASRTGDTSNRTTQYTIGNTTVELNATNNINNEVDITNVAPTNGVITIGINKKSTATYGYLGVLEITEHSAGTANQAPVADAGSDQTITLPTSAVTLAGSGTDADGTIASYAWAKISGGSATIQNPSAASTSVTGLTAGTYTFQLTVTDNTGATASDMVLVTVNSAANQAPVANAGADQAIALPVHSVTLNGTGSSDSDGTIASYAWVETTSGAATIQSRSAATTTVTDLGPGTYTFRLTVTDNSGATGTDTVTVTVAPEEVSACPAQQFAVLGSSTAAGYGLNPVSDSWVNRYAAYVGGLDSSTVLNLAVGGFSTYNAMPTGFVPPAGRPSPDTAHNVTAALASNPDVIFINLPSNDVANGYSLSEIESNFQTIVSTANAQGVPVWVTTTQPRNMSSALIAKQAQLRDWITATYGSHALDFWSVVANADGTVNATYGQGDGIHLNALGHQVLFNRVAGAGVMTTLCGSQQPGQQEQQQNTPPTVTGSLTSVTLTGTGTDADGAIASYMWTELSGPAAAITSPEAATTTVTNLMPGSYVFRLTATDDHGVTATQDIAFTIN